MSQGSLLIKSIKISNLSQKIHPFVKVLFYFRSRDELPTKIFDSSIIKKKTTEITFTDEFTSNVTLEKFFNNDDHSTKEIEMIMNLRSNTFKLIDSQESIKEHILEKYDIPILVFELYDYYKPLFGNSKLKYCGTYKFTDFERVFKSMKMISIANATIEGSEISGHLSFDINYSSFEKGKKLVSSSMDALKEKIRRLSVGRDQKPTLGGKEVFVKKKVFVKEDKVLLEIFSFLRIVDLMVIRLVSKQWQKVIISCKTLWKNFQYSISLVKNLTRKLERPIDTYKQMEEVTDYTLEDEKESISNSWFIEYVFFLLKNQKISKKQRFKVNKMFMKMVRVDFFEETLLYNVKIHFESMKVSILDENKNELFSIESDDEKDIVVDLDDMEGIKASLKCIYVKFEKIDEKTRLKRLSLYGISKRKLRNVESIIPFMFFMHNDIEDEQSKVFWEVAKLVQKLYYLSMEVPKKLKNDEFNYQSALKIDDSDWERICYYFNETDDHKKIDLLIEVVYFLMKSNEDEFDMLKGRKLFKMFVEKVKNLRKKRETTKRFYNFFSLSSTKRSKYFVEISKNV